MRTIIVGNKLFNNLHIGKVIDRFDNIIRCNLGLPLGFNGTKFGSLGMCNHLYSNVITKKINIDNFKKTYPVFKSENVDYFFKNFKQQNFEKVFYAQSVSTKDKYNVFLKSIGCPHWFKRDPRTGYAIMLSELVSGNNDIFITNFSIINNEVRDTFYTMKGKGDSFLHDSESEMNVLRWLHDNNKIDASLCLLDDVKDIKFIDNDDLKPSEFIKKILGETYEKNFNIKNK